MARSPGSLCINLAHQDGEHGPGCLPPADPSKPELRLLRAIFGLCPDCDREEDHDHACVDCGKDQPLDDGSYCYHDPDLPRYVRPYRAETDRGVVILVTPTYLRAARLLDEYGYGRKRLMSLAAFDKDPADPAPAVTQQWGNTRITREMKEQIHDDWLEELGWDG